MKGKTKRILVVVVKWRHRANGPCKVKMSDSEIKWTKTRTLDICSIKRVTTKFREISHCSRATQRQRNVQKKVCCTCKVAFLLIRHTVVLHRSPALPSPLSIARVFIYLFFLTNYKYYRKLRWLNNNYSLKWRWLVVAFTGAANGEVNMHTSHRHWGE